MPSKLFTAVRRSIFSSQADFIGLPTAAQNELSEVLGWLGVATNPPIHLVVQHLRHCIEQNESVKGDLWQELQARRTSPEVRSLRNEPCVWSSQLQRYVDPVRCFWSGSAPLTSPHGFPMPDSLRPYRPLFDDLGVRDRPSVGDVVEVLADIAAHHGGAFEPLPDPAAAVVEAIWVFLHDELRHDRCTPADLVPLRTIECVLDAAGVPRRPTDVLFRDSSRIAQALQSRDVQRLISRPENTALALEAVGVEHLRSRVRVEEAERSDAPEESMLGERVRARRQLLVRVLSQSMDDPRSAVDGLADRTSFVEVEQLTVVETITFGSAIVRTDAFERLALYRPDEDALLFHDTAEGSQRWVQAAAELAAAVGLEGDEAARAAPALRAVLEEETYDDVRAALDGYGFSALDEAVEVAVQPVVEDAGDTVDDLENEDLDTNALGAADEDEDVTSASAEPSPTQQEDAASARVRQDSGSPTDAAEPDGAASPGTGQDASDASRAPKHRGGPPAKSADEPQERRAQRPRAPMPPQRRRSRLRSYVLPSVGPDSADDDAAESPEAAERRRDVDARAIAAVLAYERNAGRSPSEREHHHQGWDVESDAADGSRRFIEVKGTSPAWTIAGVGLSRAQFEAAERLGGAFWLYVVEVGPNGATTVHRIQDPANRIAQFFFDDGWAVAAGDAEVTRSAVPALPSPAIGRPSVPLLSPRDGEGVVGQVDPGALPTGPDLFAVQVVGDALGMRWRGGVVIARRTDEPPDTEEWVVVELDRDDPDTGSPISIRLWSPDRDLDGNITAVYLRSDTDVPPIVLSDLNEAALLGVQVARRTLDELTPEGR